MTRGLTPCWLDIGSGIGGGGGGGKDGNPAV